MKVITGTAKGRKLVAPPGLETRPTSAMVKEAVFSIVQFDVEGANVLDLFAGSGQMGIEALSRGAKFCVFVDTAKQSQAALRENLEHTGFTTKSRLSATDARSYLKTASGPFDIVFLDPPYHKGGLPTLLVELAPVMSRDGIIICETAKEDELPETAGDIPKYRTYRYGKTCITVYRRQIEE